MSVRGGAAGGRARGWRKSRCEEVPLGWGRTRSSIAGRQAGSEWRRLVEWRAACSLVQQIAACDHACEVRRSCGSDKQHTHTYFDIDTRTRTAPYRPHHILNLCGYAFFFSQVVWVLYICERACFVSRCAYVCV